MSVEEITFLGKELSIRRLRSSLWGKLKETRPTLAWTSVCRAFEVVESNTVLQKWIREEARDFLAGKGVVFQAPALVGA